MRAPRRVLAVVLVGSFLALSAPAFAATATYTFSGNSANDGPVSASATATTSAGGLSVTIQNLLANPKSVGENISDITIFLSSAPGTPSYNGTQTNPTVSISGGGSFTTGSTTNTWALSTVAGNGIHLDDLTAGACGPSCTIIGAPGAGGYTNANGSIAGNGPHNPFLNQAATFVLTLTGAITAATTITGITFSFGTEAGDDHVGILVNTVPVPGALILFGSALAGLGLLRRRRSATVVAAI